MIPSLEGWPTKAKEAPSPHGVRLAPLDTRPVLQCLRDKKKMDITLILSIKAKKKIWKSINTCSLFNGKNDTASTIISVSADKEHITTFSQTFTTWTFTCSYKIPMLITFPQKVINSLLAKSPPLSTKNLFGTPNLVIQCCCNFPTISSLLL